MRRSRNRLRPRQDRAPQKPITASTTSTARHTTRSRNTTPRNSTRRRSKTGSTQKDLKYQTYDAKRGAKRIPFLSFYAGSSRKLRWSCCVGFASDTHRMRGVISLVFALSPVESLRLFPYLAELTGKGLRPCIAQFKRNLAVQETKMNAVEKLLYE